MYDGNSVEIDFGSSYREVRVSEGFELSGVDCIAKWSLFLTQTLSQLSFRGQKMREPRSDWAPLGVNFKNFDEHPRLFRKRFPLPGYYGEA